ncbi:choline ABC transporter substrate-binding protein [Fluviispira sanaruensis]|uniref:Choline ABC transporter substrate-binding protein n=1 Tax=Fluviispira sanaruensis TaxID=2493639 RepID=A0A4P2VMZ1_FLUSA|nr:choline ABC transporter substrate-binding protein [Fluviispira sanaruensis]BBH53434.1 choline ABC transporter substrate-binding protein [Fluviispira sanaruensis]
MRKICFLFTVALSLLVQKTYAMQNCKVIRVSDVGWTDITATTSVAHLLLKAMGYEVKEKNLSLQITFNSLKNNDIDVFFGAWLPSMASILEPYEKNKQIEKIGTLLQNAKYTLAVPSYVYDSGVQSMADLAKYNDKFQSKIFAIEPGNDGNKNIQKMIDGNAYGLKNWKMVESSEQAMLMQVYSAYKNKKWIVFLGWQPHPMNTKIYMKYLKGGENYFGPDQGKSTVHTTTRKNYAIDCPNVANFLKNIQFSINDENELMDMILYKNIEPKEAAEIWLKVNLPTVEKWIVNVNNFDGTKTTLQTIEKNLFNSKK